MREIREDSPICPLCWREENPIHLIRGADCWFCVAGCYYTVTDEELKKMEEKETIGERS